MLDNVKTYPEDFAAHRAMMEGKQETEPVKPDQESAAPAGDVKQAEAAPESAPESTQERNDKGQFKAKEDPEAELPPGVQKRIQKEIDKAVKARREAERYAEELRVKATQGAAPAKTEKPEPADKPTAPRLSQFDTIEDYETARDAYQEKLISWNLAEVRRADEQKAKEAENRKAAETFAGRVEEAKTKHADFEEVAFSENVPYSQAMWSAVQTLPEGADVAYYFGQHPEAADRISKLPELAAVVEIGKIVARLAPEPEKPPKPVVSKAPAPPAIVSGGGVPVAADPLSEEWSKTQDFTTWRKAREAQLARR